MWFIVHITQHSLHEPIRFGCNFKWANWDILYRRRRIYRRIHFYMFHIYSIYRLEIQWVACLFCWEDTIERMSESGMVYTETCNESTLIAREKKQKKKMANNTGTTKQSVQFLLDYRIKTRANNESMLPLVLPPSSLLLLCWYRASLWPPPWLQQMTHKACSSHFHHENGFYQRN